MMIDMVTERLERPEAFGLADGVLPRPRRFNKARPQGSPTPLSDLNFFCAVHDLNGLCASISSVTELLESGDAEPREARECAEALRIVAHSLLDSRQTPDRDQTTLGSVRDRLESTARISQPFLRNYNMELHISCPRSSQPIWLNWALLERAVLNLIWNAAKHAQTGTGVWLSAEQVGAALVLRVEDDGRGLGDQSIAKLSAAFQRGLGCSEDGWGLGLYLVHTATTAMKGDLRFGNSKYGGALFELTCPIAQPRSS